MGWFGPGKRQVWERVAEDLGATYQKGGLFKDDRMTLPVGPWTATLDTYAVSSGESNVTYTRMRVPFVNPEGFRFKVYRKGMFSELGKLLGMQHIQVAHPEIEERYILKGNDESRVGEMFDDAGFRELVLSGLPKGCLEIKDHEGWFKSKYPPETDLLLFQHASVIKDPAWLGTLFDLFATALDRLESMGVAVADDPGVVV